MYCEWAEMELAHNNFKSALDVLYQATREPDITKKKRSKDEEGKLPVQMRVHRSPKVWALLCDLEESLGTLDSTKAVYYKWVPLSLLPPTSAMRRL